MQPIDGDTPQGDNPDTATPQAAPPANNGAGNPAQPPPTRFDPNNPPEWVALARKEEREKGAQRAIDELLGKLGVSSTDDIAAMQEEIKAFRESQQTEFEKLQNAVAEKEQAMSAKEQEIAQLKAQLEAHAQAEQKRSIETALLSAANLPSPTDEDFLRLVWDAHKEDALATFAEGKIDSSKVEAVVNAVAEKRPQWFKRGIGIPPSANRNHQALRQADFGNIPAPGQDAPPRTRI